MYLNKIQLKNIRSFKDTTVEIPPTAGWHVILGDNGSGKSTLIRSIALAMIGEPELHQLAFKQRWDSWLRYKEDEAEITLEFENGLQRYASFIRKDESVIRIKASEEDLPVFSAGYGSFRRLTGGSDDYDNVWNNSPKLAAHLSVFKEDVALDKVEVWMQKIYRDAIFSMSGLQDATPEKIIMDSYTALRIALFINNSKLLLNKYILQEPVSKNQEGLRAQANLLFEDCNFKNKTFLIKLEELSDGYKSVLALVLELIRQLFSFHQNDVTKIFDTKNDKITIPGIVLIDEVAAHLHPSWQARIGDWFTEYFPNIQFIVSTHSPIICRSAKKGSIQKIIHQGEATIIDKIEGKEKNQLVYGDILDAYNTDLFGENISRSQDAVVKLKRLAKLETLKQFGQPLTPEQEEELVELSKLFPSDANSFF
ncbi:MAG: AAA family ATPase [Aureispira sp.]